MGEDSVVQYQLSPPDLPGAPPPARCCGDVHRNRVAARAYRGVLSGTFEA